LTQRKYFGVGLSRPWMKTFTDDRPIAHDDSSNHWVWGGLAPRLLGKTDASMHHLSIEFCIFH
jgi:hypothetical protein